MGEPRLIYNANFNDVLRWTILGNVYAVRKVSSNIRQVDLLREVDSHLVYHNTSIFRI